MWQANLMHSYKRPPHPIQSWIYEKGSLTQRLRANFTGTLTVSVLFLERQKPFAHETQLLKLSCQQRVLVREVLLSVENKPLILARTCIPFKTLKSTQYNLSRLGNRPLGEVIFSYPKLQRKTMDYGSIACNNFSYAIKQEIKLNQPIWGRRIIYSIKGHALLINEFFLPELLQIP